MTSTPNQMRAICPCCFREQAVRSNGRMVQHGYERPDGWHQNVGDCYGTNKPHFGTKEGRAVTLECVGSAKMAAKYQRELAGKVRARKAPVLRYNGKVIDNPTDHDVEWAAAYHESNARMADAEAKTLQRRYDAWKAAKPRAVIVVKRGPVVHLDGGDGRKACAGPFNRNPYGGSTTTDRAKVTCTRCQANFKWIDARAARRGQ